MSGRMISDMTGAVTTMFQMLPIYTKSDMFGAVTTLFLMLPVFSKSGALRG